MQLVISFDMNNFFSIQFQNLLLGTRVLRAMPNTACLVHAGATVVAPGKSIHSGDTSLVQTLFQTVGVCYVGTEDQLDAVTGLSGSGPAYVRMRGFLQYHVTV